ncbi:MAG: shikimate kinase, partial [Anaerolineae bacterium]|nr:shikimate kinase [Anaerolineae bacterium]
MSGRQPRNVVLTGFMGCGKSSVGRLVGDALQRPFVDMDLELAERFGMSIPEVFSVRGEAAFREAESDLVREL